MIKTPEHSGELIKRINEIMEKNANSDLQSKDVTFAQLKMMIVLEQAEDHSHTLKELEQIFGMTQATIAGTAARLEKKKLVEGYIDCSDRRIKHIRLSEKGQALLDCSKASVDAREKWMVASLLPEERAELYRLLLKVYEAIREEDDDK